MLESGVTPLTPDCVDIVKNGQTLILCGVSGSGSTLNDAAGRLRRADCVIAMAYGPDVLPSAVTAEAGDGGMWADLLLTGHTHGGQIRLFGRSVLSLSRLERQFLSGWYWENSLPLLITEGVGCEGANLRVGTRGEVWLITLRCAGPQSMVVFD